MIKRLLSSKNNRCKVKSPSLSLSSMCGICGFIYTTASFSPQDNHAILTKMNDALYHRGPDDEGHYLTPTAGLAMRRLAIIDLPGGHQPMSNAQGTLWIVFNGEIYNFKELRQDLIAKGYTFKTHSDTEVLLYLYEEKGDNFVDDLNGMFAIAIWNTETQTLLLVRDRFGKKPLYYTIINGNLIFASELKALLQHPLVRSTLDPDGLSLFLSYDYIPAPHTIFKGISKLPAGHLLKFSQGNTNISRYWNLRFHYAETSQLDETKLAARLIDHLKRAVAYRMISDVPLGVFLSGGIDSSLITALMCKLAPPESIQTFSIHFEEASFDESSHSDLVATYFGTSHHTARFRSRDLIDLIPRFAATMDEPFADASIFPTYLLSQFTRQHVTVALCGDGADELLAGYPTFVADRLAERYLKLPRFFRHGVEALIHRLPVSTRNMSLDFKLKQFVSGLSEPGVRRQAAWLSGFLPQELNSILSNDLLAQRTATDPYSLVNDELAYCNSKDPLDRAVYFYIKFYLAEGILTKSDRASMANSLEVRAPFLDKDVTEFVTALPPSLKLRGSTTKYLLKQAARELLPASIIDRPKKGFGIPVGQWFRHELKELIGDHLKSDRMRTSGLFKTEVIDRLLDEHWAGKCDHRKKLFPLFMFALWQTHHPPTR